MTKELQDHVWKHCLPKEFKEEVKKDYQYAVKNRNRSVLQRGASDTLEYFFGEHNLTSDVEGEEMLIVSRKEVQDLFNEYQELYEETKGKCHDKEVALNASRFYGKMCALSDLFDSKCLPDEKEFAENANCKEPNFKVGDIASYVCSPTLKHKCTVTKVMQNEHSDKYEYNVMFEWGKPGMWILESELEPYTEPKQPVSDCHHLQEPKPAEPKFHVGQMVRCLNNGEIYIVLAKVGKHHYSLQGVEHDVHEDYLEPYTEPKEDHFVVNNEMVKDLDTILKDSFSKERRLNIAKDFASVLLSRLNYDPFTAQINCCCSDGAAVNPYINIARIALSVADALIAESEKGGSNGED